MANIHNEISNALATNSDCIDLDTIRLLTGRSRRVILSTIDKSADFYYDADSDTVTYCGGNSPNQEATHTMPDVTDHTFVPANDDPGHCAICGEYDTDHHEHKPGVVGRKTCWRCDYTEGN